MAIRVFDKLSRAKAFCKKKNKNAWKYSYNWQKRKKGGYLIYKYYNRGK